MPALEVRDDAFEVRIPFLGASVLILIADGDLLAATAIKHEAQVLRFKVLHRHLDTETMFAGYRLENTGVPGGGCRGPCPGDDRSLGDGQVLVRDDEVRIQCKLHSQAGASGA